MKNLLFFLLLVNAVNVFAQNKKIKIEGIIDTVPNSEYYISFGLGDSIFRDTIRLDMNRKFSVEYYSDEPVYFRITVPNDINSPLYESDILGNIPLYYFWVEPNETTVFKGYSKRKQIVENSRIQDEFLKYQALKEGRLTKKGLAPNSTSENEIIKDYLEENSPTYFSLSLLDLLVIRYDDVFYVKNYFYNLPLTLKKTYRFKLLQKNLEAKTLGVKGSKFPEFQMRTQNDSLVVLKSLRDKYVLIDFWASWCVPCRAQNPLFKYINNKYGDHLYVISISLDDNKKDWVKAIEDDNLDWIQVSDLNGFNSPIAKQLLITGIPQNYLIDHNGVIVDKNLTKEELIKLLQELFEGNNKSADSII